MSGRRIVAGGAGRERAAGYLPDDDARGRGGGGGSSGRPERRRSRPRRRPLGDHRRLGRARDLPTTSRRTPLRDLVDWSRVHVWWGDDRFVPARPPALERAAFTQVLLTSGGDGGRRQP